MTEISLSGRGARGESQADILRRTGQFGVLPTDTDAEAVGKLNALAAESAATAEAASGPTYISTVAGLAATTSGEAFAVDAGGGLVSVYLNSSGAAVFQRTMATTQALAASTGAGLVGKAGGGTVQGHIDALAAPAGSALVGLLQSGIGAVARTVQAKLREIAISVMDYGAVGDGVTDDTTAVQAAVYYAETIGEGAKVVFPAGKYLFNSTVTVMKSGVLLEGAGAPATWIVNGQANAPAIKFGDGVTQYNRNGLSNMVFGQKSGVTAVAGNCGLFVVKCGNFALSNVQVFQFPASLYDGVVYDAVTQSYMNTIGIQGCTNRGMYLFNQTFDIYMVNGRCDASAYGIEFRDCQGIQGANWTAYGNSVNAYRFATSGSTDNNQFFFLTNFIGDTSGQHNWKLEQLSLSVLTNCWAATQAAQVGNYDGFYLSGADLEEIAFNNCIAVSNNRHGMNIDYATRIQINGGFYGSNFKPSAFGGLGPRNGLAGAGSGLLIGAFADRVSVKGGKFENNESYGIDVISGATKIELEGIETRFNIIGGLRNNANASAAECRIKNVAGYNPQGYLAPPAVPASGVAYTNLTGCDAMVYLDGGTVSNIKINGNSVLRATPASVFVAAGETIAVVYSSVPTWQWRLL